MTPGLQIGTCILTGEAFERPQSANDNWLLKPDWMTPAELMQRVRREKELLRRELEADPGLLDDPTHRSWRAETEAMEACALWHLYGVR